MSKMVMAVLGLFFLAGAAVHAEEQAVSETASLVVPEVIRAKFTGDLPQIRERGILRALVSPSRTDFFLDGARPRGILVELLDQYLKKLNKGRKKAKLKVAVKYVVVPFNELIPALLEGRGDIAVANLTITPEREAKVAFVRGRENLVDELLVTNKDVAGIRELDDLAGRNVKVLAGSSYAEHLRRLNERLSAAGKTPVTIEEADPHLVTEDLLEMTNAGVIDITVADDYRARLWASVLPDIVVHENVKVNTGGTLGWAVRKENSELLKSLESAAPGLRAGTMIGNTLIKRYYQNTKWITNPLSKSEREKLDRLVKLFQKYGDRYGFDWLALAAQGYQESALDHSVRSPAGAVGIMQLLPRTAKDPNVAIPDISIEENNIHAGAKYLAFLRNRYFDDPALAEEDRLAFAWAAYNAGPANVKRMRGKTKALGLDPNRWFGNVEHGALAVIGQETVQYVRNIYKYYITYRALLEMGAARRSMIEGSGRNGQD
jgi:membrane-bound lytic murein transglycosylase MltF